MEVAKIISTISPNELANASIFLADADKNIFYIVKDQKIIKPINLNIVKALDDRNCLIWSSKYLKEKSLNIISKDEYLPASFEQGPDNSFINQHNDSKSQKDLTLATKITAIILMFLVLFLALIMIATISSKGTLSVLEAVQHFGIVSFIVSSSITALFSYYSFFNSK